MSLVVLSIVLVAVTVTPVAAKKKVVLSKKKVTMELGKSTTLKLKNAKKVKWSSSDKTIVKVSKKGKCKAMKLGTAKIIAKAAKKKYVCKVTVTPDIDETKIKINYNNEFFTEKLYQDLAIMKYSVGGKSFKVKDAKAIKAIYSKLSALTLTKVSHDSATDSITGFSTFAFELKDGSFVNMTFKGERIYLADGTEYVHPTWDNAFWDSLVGAMKKYAVK